MNDVLELTVQLAAAKEAENIAKAKREAIEAELAKVVGVPDSWTGSMSNPVGDYKLKLTRRMNVRIDAAKLDEIAIGGLAEEVHTYFRYKPELDAKAWKEAPAHIVQAFSPALTMTPGKATFTVEPKNKKGDE